MGWLADLGRSNAGMNTVKGLSDLTSDIQNRRVQAESAARQEKAFQYQEKAMADQELQNNRIVDITTTPQYLALPPEVQKSSLNWLASNGYTDMSGRGKMKDIATGVSMVEQTPKLFQQFMQPVIEAKKQAVLNAYNMMTQESAKPKANPEKIAQLKAVFDQARLAYGAATDNFTKHLDKLDEIEAAKKASEEKPLVLGPGQKAFMKGTGNGYGEVAVGGEADTKPVILSPGQKAFAIQSDGSFKPVAEGNPKEVENKPIILSPGQKAFVQKADGSMEVAATGMEKEVAPLKLGVGEKAFVEQSDGSFKPIAEGNTAEPKPLILAPGQKAFIQQSDGSMSVAATGEQKEPIPLKLGEGEKAFIEQPDGTFKPIAEGGTKDKTTVLGPGQKAFNSQWQQVAEGGEKPDAEKDATTKTINSWSQALFNGKSWEELNPKEKGMVLQKIQSNAEKLRMTAPASNIFIGTNPDTGNPIIMPSRGKPTMTEINAPAGGIAGKTVSEDYKKDVTAIKQARDLVGTLKKQWQTLGITNRGSAVGAATKGRLGTDANAKVYMDAKMAFLGNLSRSIAAERGVLTEQDIQRINGVVANVGFNPFMADSAAEANKKWGMIDDIIKSAERRMKERKGITFKSDENTSSVKQSGRFTVKEIK